MAFAKSLVLVSTLALKVAAAPVVEYVTAATVTEFAYADATGRHEWSSVSSSSSSSSVSSVNATLSASTTSWPSSTLVTYSTPVAAWTSEVVASQSAKTAVHKASTTADTKESTSATTTAKSSSSSSSPSGSKGGSSSGGSYSGGKRGIAFNAASDTTYFSGSSVGWAYNWGSSAGGGMSDSVEYIPMLWSASNTWTSTWSDNANTAISNGATALFGFNEPDESSQANMAISESVSAWQKYMEPFAGQASLVAPAVTNGPAPMGLTYLENFISECTDCTIDACAIHWYDGADQIDYFKTYIPEAYAACNSKPIWITEFGTTTGTEDEVASFLSEAMEFLDGLDYVSGYAYFFAAPSTGSSYYLLNSGGNGLSTIGSSYDS